MSLTPTLERTPDRRWTTIDAAADHLNLSRDTIRRMIRSGELEARKFGRSVRITVASLETAGRPVQAVGR